MHPYLAPEMAESFRHEALFTGPNVREAVNDGRADYMPAFLSEIAALFRSGRLPMNVAFINVSPPDAHGYCSLGTSIDCTAAEIESAERVAAQITTALVAAYSERVSTCTLTGIATATAR